MPAHLELGWALSFTPTDDADSLQFDSAIKRDVYEDFWVILVAA
jgi:hypothetical protein